MEEWETREGQQIGCSLHTLTVFLFYFICLLLKFLNSACDLVLGNIYFMIIATGRQRNEKGSDYDLNLREVPFWNPNHMHQPDCFSEYFFSPLEQILRDIF